MTNPAPVSIYLESRYRKLVRGLPQTIHYCPACKGNKRRRVGCALCGGFGKLSKDSVQELVARVVLPAYRARHGKFHGAGREDIDVRMLGRGRPFVFEVVGPRVFAVDLESLRAAIHDRCGDRIELEPFTAVDPGRVVFWKEAQFAKVYRAEIDLEQDVAPEVLARLGGRAVRIAQRTPQRVAHRRADLEREREVVLVCAQAIAPHRISVDVRCSHGTYVKEWISGDLGRTKPSLADELGVACRCDALDVLDVLAEERP